MTFHQFFASTKPQSRKTHVLYAKDIDCPVEWAVHLRERIPEELVFEGSDDLMCIAPPDLRVENLMIYIGGPGTLTPAHSDLCGSIGHNLLVHGEPNAYALWAVIRPQDYAAANRFWIEHGDSSKALTLESSFMPLEVLAQAPFPVHIIEQRVGDFVLLPGNAPHQVINQGEGMSVKVSWNRSTARSIPRAIREVLPMYRSVQRSEEYRLKYLGYFGL
ncbi:hypothetical protein BJ085DRAFT_20691, partial [Dimargaris cristalligena]